VEGYGLKYLVKGSVKFISECNWACACEDYP
jgi:hypothetical protein